MFGPLSPFTQHLSFLRKSQGWCRKSGASFNVISNWCCYVHVTTTLGQDVQKTCAQDALILIVGGSLHHIPRYHAQNRRIPTFILGAETNILLRGTPVQTNLPCFVLSFPNSFITWIGCLYATIIMAGFYDYKSSKFALEPFQNTQNSTGSLTKFHLTKPQEDFNILDLTNFKILSRPAPIATNGPPE